MSKERLLPIGESSDLSTVRLLVNNKELKEEYHLVSVTVKKEVNKIPWARIVLLDGDPAGESFRASNSADFVPGNAVEILAGYHQDEAVLFKGIILRHGLQSRQSRSSLLIIECRDGAVAMTVVRQNKIYRDKKDSEVIEEIAGDYNLEKEIEETGVQHSELVKYYTTDWDFIVSRAEANGQLVLLSDGKLTVKAPDTGQEALFSLLYGETILELETELDALSQLASVEAGAWNYADQELVTETAGEPDFNEQGNLTSGDLSRVLNLDGKMLLHGGALSSGELKTWAGAMYLKSRMAKIMGRVKCQGIALPLPGRMITLEGVGDRFNGKVFVTGVLHQITTRNWETTVFFGLSAESFIRKTPSVSALPSAGLLPAVHGLQIGIVMQLQDDPAGEDRILVKVPILRNEEEGLWARVALPDAGDKRGTFFRPEIGDEVLLGFLNNDPRYPLVLGMLHSNSKPAPVTASDDNHEKGIFTRSGMKVLFNDDKKSIQVLTPNGNRLLISDDEGSITIEDENKNRLQMTAEGILLQSDGKIEIKAGSDLNLEAVNVNIKADAQLKGEGQGGAELSSGAITTIKGSLVKLN